MWEVTRKGLVAHKFRLLLTSISIVLGVAFVAGTFVFTDTISSVFDHLFTQTTSGTDAVVRSKLPFKVNAQGGGPQQDRAPVPSSLVPIVASTPGVVAAQGSVGGYADRYEAVTQKDVAKETANDIKQGLSFFNTFLLIFALVALFVGAFIIYNTFSIIVAQRSRELGLLKAVGASGRQVTWSVAVEALAVGVFSSIVGLAFGILVAAGLQALLKGFGIDLPSGGIEIRARTVIVAMILGIVVTFVSALSPARRAARVPPVAAIGDHVTTATSGRRRYIAGGIITGLGATLLGV